jgi:hypothetical protein
MDTTYHLVARMMVQYFDEETGVDIVHHYNYGKIDWILNIPDLIEYITKDYACDRYEEQGYSLISTPSIIKKIEYNKLLEYIDKVEYDICVIKLFDYNNEMDFFDENERFLQDKHNAMWNMYVGL